MSLTMPMRRALLAFCLWLNTAHSASSSEEGDLSEVKHLARLITPALETEKDPLEIALLLRDQIHRAGIPANAGVPTLTTSELRDWATAYRLSNIERTRANACNGKSVLYMIALRAFGISSRMVALYATATDPRPVWTHAAVDVRVDGEWVGMDPTYNFSLKNEGGERISWRDAVQLYRDDSAVVIDTDGKPTIKGQALSDIDWYGADFRNLAAFALLGPWSGGEAENITPGWDGKVKTPDGSAFDAWSSITETFYKDIASADVQQGE
jgi:transglutaminase superfamily protein